MNKALQILLFSLFIGSVSCSSSSSKPEQANTSALKASDIPRTGAVIAGDFPDPSVIRVGETYWATATTSAWAPAFSLMNSTDLVNWKVVGSVFATKPEWTDGNYWAPEITKLGNKFAVYYSAKSKANGRMCLGVATSRKVEGPYSDHGPLICQVVGSIDAMPVQDEKGRNYLFWKEDGNSQKLPTPIWVQPMTADGLKLVGKPIQAIRNDAPWEAHLVEGPYVFKRGEYWYMFYAASGCCTKTCDYKVGVARSKVLAGPWEKNPANPIISENETWKCPGHGSVVADAKGQQVFLYHAYHKDDSVYVGRQAVADLVEWNPDGWPSINKGKGPSSHKDGFLGVALRNEEHFVSDDFSASKLKPTWQWPQNDQPRVQLKDGNLLLSGPGASGEAMKAILASPTTTSDYVAQTSILISKMKSGAYAGLAAVGSPANALGASYSGNRVYLWTRTKDRNVTLSSIEIPKTEVLHLRMSAERGHLFTFSYSVDGQSWTELPGELNGQDLPPWDLGIRVALTAGGPTGSQAIFDSFSMQPSRGEK